MHCKKFNSEEHLSGQACTSLAELRLSEPGDLSAYSAVSAAELSALQSKLPYLRSVMLGGQVLSFLWPLL